MSKKRWTLGTQKSQIAILVLNQCSISAVFQIVRFAGDQKTALSGESLYIQQRKSPEFWNTKWSKEGTWFHSFAFMGEEGAALHCRFLVPDNTQKKSYGDLTPFLA